MRFSRLLKLAVFAILMLPQLAQAEDTFMAAVPTVASSDGLITVTVPAGTVEGSAAVYLVWDTTDRGERFGAWANSAKIDVLDAAGGVFVTNGVDLAIANGAAIRAFVASDMIDLYGSMTKKNSARAYVNTHYVRTTATTKLEMDLSHDGVQDPGDSTTLNWPFGLLAQNNGTDYERVGVSVAGSPITSAYGYLGGSSVISLANVPHSVKSTVIDDFSAKKVSWGGVSPEAVAAAYANPKGEWPLYVFAANLPDIGKGTQGVKDFNRGNLTVYGFRVYEGGANPVANYVPARSGGAHGLYETVGGTFCPVQATGSYVLKDNDFTVGEKTGEAVNSETAIPSAAATYDGAGDEPLASLPTVASSRRAITVTVPAGAVEAPSLVYLAWDTADKGEDIGNWAKRARIGEATSAGVTIKVGGIELGVPNGAAIRAFVTAKSPCSLFELMTKLATAQSVVDTGYIPSAQTKKVELEFSFTTAGAVSGNWLLGSVYTHSSGKVTRIGATRDGSTASSLYCFGHNDVATSVSSEITGISNTSRGVMTLEMGSQATWSKSGSTPKTGLTELHEKLNMTLPCPLFVFGGSSYSETAKTVTTNVFGNGTLTVYGLRVYESQKVRDYVPAQMGGAVGFYETISERFYPAVGKDAAAGYNMGGDSEEIAIPGDPVVPSAAATYDGTGDEPLDPNYPVANDAVNGKVTVVGISHTFANNRFDWDLNPTSNPIDNEWTWQLNRMEFWTQLAKAYTATENPRYADAFVQQLTDWLDQTNNGTPPSSGWNDPLSMFRTIEEGLRLQFSWANAYNAFCDYPGFTKELQARFIASARKQAEHLLAHPSGDQAPNWMLLEMSGVYAAASLWSEGWDRAATVRETAASKFYTAIQGQLLPDGLQCELSPDYQGVFYASAVSLYNTANNFGTAGDLPADYMDILENGADAVVKMMTPAFTSPSFNDCGSPQPVSSVMNSAATIFPARTDFLWAKTKGAEGEPPEGETASRFMPYGGFAIMRTDWSSNASFLAFDVGPLGVGYHAHQDKLGFTLWKGGEELVFDDGGGPYDESTYRQYGRFAYDHNVMVVDGLVQNRTEPERVDSPIDADWSSTATEDCATGVYDQGWGDQKQQLAKHTRTVVFDKVNDRFTITDDASSADGASHNYQLRFQVDSTEVQVISNGTVALVRYAAGREWGLRLRVCEGGVITTKSGYDDTKPYAGWFVGRDETSSNILHAATTIIVSAPAKKTNHRFVTELKPIPAAEAHVEIVDYSDFAEAVSYQENALTLKWTPPTSAVAPVSARLIYGFSPDMSDGVSVPLGESATGEEVTKTVSVAMAEMLFLAIEVTDAVGVKTSWSLDPLTPTCARGYVQNGLVAWWDGIDNAGRGQHESSLLKWKDLIGGVELDLPSGAYAKYVNVRDTSIFIQGASKTYPTNSIQNLQGNVTLEAVARRGNWNDTTKMTSVQSIVDSPYGRIGYRSENHFYFTRKDAKDTKAKMYEAYPANAFPTDLHTLGLLVDLSSQKYPTGRFYLDGTLVDATKITGGVQELDYRTGNFRFLVNDVADVEYYSIRVYNGNLSEAERQQNALMDQCRFGGAAHYTPNFSIETDGGNVSLSPAEGSSYRLVAGESFTCRARASETAAVIGWELQERDGSGWEMVSSGVGPVATFTAAANEQRLVWKTAPYEAPDGDYQRVSYIGADGHQLLNTLYKPTKNCVVEFDLQLVGSFHPGDLASYNSQLGQSINKGSSSTLGVNVGSGEAQATTFYFWLKAGSSTPQNKAFQANTVMSRNRLRVDRGSGEVKWEDETYVSSVKGTDDCTEDFYLFGRMNPNVEGAPVPQPFNAYEEMRLYGFKVFENGSATTPIHDFVPVYSKADDCHGLLDTKTGDFVGNCLTSDGARDFTFGVAGVEIVGEVKGESANIGEPTLPYGKIVELEEGTELLIAAADVKYNGRRHCLTEIECWTYENGEWTKQATISGNSALVTYTGVPTRYVLKWRKKGVVIVFR